MHQDYAIGQLGAIRKDDLSNGNKLVSFERFLTSAHHSEDDFAEEVIVERLKFQKATIEQTVKLIIEREKAKKNNIASLASEIMDVQSQLYVYKCHVYPISPDNKRKSNLERALSELENRRRQEEVTCWKDTLKLWQELLRIAAEYKATVRKARILFPAE